MKDLALAKHRAQRLADVLLLLYWTETEGSRTYHEAEAAKAWKELKEVME